MVAIALHLVLRYATEISFAASNLPLFVALAFGGTPLVWDLARGLLQRKFGSDLLAGISIVTSVLLGEYLAGVLVVLMLSGGETLEAYAVSSASSVLRALARRMPATAFVKRNAHLEEIALADVRIGDTVVIQPHATCPIDGVVLDGHGSMDESYLTGEPYVVPKSPGASVLSGAINGDSLLTIEATKLAVDSRYAKILQVMQTSAQERPFIRRLGDQLGALYTPFALLVAIGAWWWSGDALRFLAVLVVATPCPLLIAIPVAIIGAISLSAKRSIIIRDPVVLEQVTTCRTIIFDKTGTLTYGDAQLTDEVLFEHFSKEEVLSLVASIERYSKHPLAQAILKVASSRGVMLAEATSVSEPPGRGLSGIVRGRSIEVTNRKRLLEIDPAVTERLPDLEGGLECTIAIDGKAAALYRFRDTPRKEGAAFVNHLHNHKLDRILLVSGDRESEVRYLADKVGIQEVHAGMSPEDKVSIVKAETAQARTIFVGDGINDAPALLVATVGVAFGHNSDVTTEAAGAVIMDSSLVKVDEFFHIGAHMRRIVLQSAVGGIVLSILAMGFAFFGHLPPVAGAVIQEVIDIFAVVNSLRAGFRPRKLSDF